MSNYNDTYIQTCWYGKIDNLHAYYDGNQLQRVEDNISEDGNGNVNGNRNGRQSMYLFPGGYCNLNDPTVTNTGNPGTDSISYHYYNKDHLGNNREVINESGAIEQIVHYYPFGTPFTDGSSTNIGLQPYLYGNKELDMMHGLNTYDFGARNYNPLLPMWDRMDPMCEKYYGVNPYLYCLNSPLKLSDPTGKEVVADSLSQINITHTLTREEAKYVRFDENGVLDLKRLRKSRSTSTNFIALKVLALSELKYVFKVTDKDDSGQTFFENESNGNNFRGVTEMPNAGENPSPDDNIYILVGNVLSESQQAYTTAHEAYGHAYVYEHERDVLAASHTYVSKLELGKWDEEFNVQEFVSIKIPTNLFIEKRINKVVNQAKHNYYEWYKK
ncbi:MAG: RHS repeat-associated core domain-containing protein [Prevotella sp.]|nr:RHS repeat-associated core domain-containing protein [Prevotella sp.]